VFNSRIDLDLSGHPWLKMFNDLEIRLFAVKGYLWICCTEGFDH